MTGDHIPYREEQKRRSKAAGWVSMREREPTHDDLPFVTKYNGDWELWTNDDWFNDLPRFERQAHKYWLPLVNPPSQ